jgi:hypothetical protein
VGPEGILQAGKRRALRDDPGREAVGIHCRNRRGPNEIRTAVAEGGNIRRKSARVGGQIFVRSELRWIYENRHGYAVGTAPRQLDQGVMPGMQCSHGRDERRDIAASAPLIDDARERRQGANDARPAMLQS